MIDEVCGDNRFEIIKKAKQDLLESTNIQTSEDEMQVIDNILFRCWQMGWLEKYNQPKADWIPCEVDMPKEEYGTYWIAVEMEGYPCFYYCSAVYTSEHGFRTHDIEAHGKIVAWQPIHLYKKEGAE